VRILRVLRQRHLALLWSSQVLSAMGDYLYTIAVLWMAVRIGGSLAGLVAAAEWGAALAFGLVGGVYADRWNRRKVMVWVDVLRGTVVLALPILAHFQALHIWQLVIAAVLLGGLGTLFDPALQASLPVLVGDTDTLQAANGLMDLTRRLARTIGPSTVGLLILVLPLEQFFTLDAVSFGLSAAAVLALGSRYAWLPRRVAGAQGGAKGIVSDIAGAARLVASRRVLAWMIVSLGIVNGLWSIAFTLGVPLLAMRVLHQGVGAYGLIVGAYGVGNVVANLVVGSLPIRRPALAFFSGKILLGLGFFVVAAAPNLWVAMLGAAIAAVGGPMGDIPLAVLLQTNLPNEQRGKVFSMNTTLSSAGVFLGTLITVPLFAHADVRLGIALAAVAMLAVGVIGLIRFTVGDSRAVAPAEATESAV
jgi:MFS transporter, DHA3 family, macrolide efflux protein